MNDFAPLPEYLLAWQAAELAAVEHMKSLGFIDAQKTSPGADGGIDVQSSEAAAQVKFYANPVGRPEVQRLRGAAHSYRIAVFYSTGGYTKEALQYADQAGVALFLMDPFGRAEAASQFGTLLADSKLVQERRASLEELKTIRYRLAGAAFRRDLALYAEFARHVRMDPDESALFFHVANALEESIRSFQAAADLKQFQSADTAFEEVQQRIRFLGWITGSELRAVYESLEEAISEGWEGDATPTSEYRLQRIATGALSLRELLIEFLEGWVEHFPDGLGMRDLGNEHLVKSAGMLLSVSNDPSILTPELLVQIEAAARAGVQQAHQVAANIFAYLLDMHVRLDLPRPRVLVAGSARVDSLASRIYQQIDVR